MDQIGLRSTIGTLTQLIGFLEQTFRSGLEVPDLRLCRCANVIIHRFFAVPADFFICRRVLATNPKQFLEPTLTVTSMESLIGPIEIHVMFAQRVAVGMK